MQATYKVREVKRLINTTLKAIEDSKQKQGYNSRIEQSIKLNNMKDFLSKLPAEGEVIMSLEDMTCIISRPNVNKG